MSRGSTSSAQSLAELERLEQQITLTLQEIDQNFNRAHRIVSTSILPIIEQYRDHSNALWEASKFWKQFFEASANITLCGVEENEQEEDDFSYTQSHENASAYGTSQADETFRTEGDEHVAYDQGDESLLDDPDLSGSTPRAPRPKSATSATFAKYPSSYEALKQELKGKGANDDDVEVEPTTPGPKQRIPDTSMTPQSSPFDPTLYEPSATQTRSGADHLLHRVLDKNYRLQATPLTTRKENKTPANKPSWRDSDSPMSSPPAAAPELRADIFSSPVRQQYTRPIAPRTPGISVQTPAKGKYREVLQSRDINADPKQTQKKLELPAKRDEISWESDSDDDADDVYKQLGMSPPKTIQFSLPQSRLLQTPAREASKRIVEELMTTAGGAFDDSDMLEDSPSVVQMKVDLDDSF